MPSYLVLRKQNYGDTIKKMMFNPYFRTARKIFLPLLFGKAGFDLLVKAKYDGFYKMNKLKSAIQPHGLPIPKFEEEFEFIKDRKYKEVLEIGCSEGVFTKYLSRVAENITAVDISKEAITRAKGTLTCEHIKFIPGNFRTINFKKKFDLIVGNEVLYYIYDNVRLYNLMNLLYRKKLIKKEPRRIYKLLAGRIYNLLESGGLFLLSTVFYEWTNRCGDDFNVNNMIAALKNTGLVEQKQVSRTARLKNVLIYEHWEDKRLLQKQEFKESEFDWNYTIILFKKQ